MSRGPNLLLELYTGPWSFCCLSQPTICVVSLNLRVSMPLFTDLLSLAALVRSLSCHSLRRLTHFWSHERPWMSASALRNFPCSRGNSAMSQPINVFLLLRYVKKGSDLFSLLVGACCLSNLSWAACGSPQLSFPSAFCQEIFGTSHTDYVDRFGVLEWSLLMQRRRYVIHCWWDCSRGQITAAPIRACLDQLDPIYVWSLLGCLSDCLVVPVCTLCRMNCNRGRIGYSPVLRCRRCEKCYYLITYDFNSQKKGVYYISS